MQLRSILYALTASSLVACSANRPDLAPAPNALAAPEGPGSGATATVEGVTIEARAGAWNGVPANLEAESIPLLVEITNDGDQPLRLRYNEMQLVAPDGRTFNAIPPFNVEGDVAERVDVRFRGSGFHVAPYLSRYYTVYDPFTGTFFYDRVYYDRYVPTSINVELPSSDMISMALPEGVLEPGGSITGFLYFEDVEDTDIGQVDFTVALVNAQSEERIGTVTILFSVQ
ncbi:MAG: hypothetical protein ACYC28_08270 [Longimicrobiales bacterium]